MIGPLTYTGWVSILAMIVLWLAMIRFGWRSQWHIGAALTVPFLAFLIYVEMTTAGPNLFEDQYGPVLIVLVMGPITVGWLLFGAAWLSHRIRNSA